MKKQVKVIRSAEKTIVIYSEPPKAKPVLVAPKQKVVPVFYMGSWLYSIRPDGRYVMPRVNFVRRIINHFTGPTGRYV